MTWRRSTNDSTFLLPLQAAIVKLFSNQSLLWAGAKLPWMNEEMNAQWDELLNRKWVSTFLQIVVKSENGGCCAWGGGGFGLGPQVRGEEDQEASHHQVGRNLQVARQPFIYWDLLGLEQPSDQIMKWRGSWAKAEALIAIFLGAGWLVLKIVTVSCFSDTLSSF